MRICHVVYATFPFDPRVRREVDALRGAGHEVTVVCLRDDGQPRREVVRGTRVHRVPFMARRGGRLRYAFQYVTFFLLSSAELLRLFRRHRFEVIHVHSLPDFQVLCALPYRLAGVRIILDLHELLPEIIQARFRSPEDGLLVRLARVAERVGILAASHVIAANDEVRRVAVLRGGRAEGITTVMNSPDEVSLRIRDPATLRSSLGLDGGPLIAYVGGINRERDFPTLFRAVALLQDRVPFRLLVVGYGSREYIESLERLVRELGLRDRVRFLPAVSHEDVLTYLALSTVGVVCYEDSPLTRVAIPTKSFEYAAAGKAMAMADLTALRNLFDGAAEFYRPGDARSLATAIEHLIAKPDHALTLAERAREVLARCSWDIMRARLLEVYARLGRARN